MFQRALTRRVVPRTGRTPCPSSAGWMKFRMPWRSAVCPVAMLVQSIGENGGSSVARLPMTPRLTRRSRVGMWPASRSGVMIFQSAASQPMRRTLLARRSGMGDSVGTLAVEGGVHDGGHRRLVEAAAEEGVEGGGLGSGPLDQVAVGEHEGFGPWGCLQPPLRSRKVPLVDRT